MNGIMGFVQVVNRTLFQPFRLKQNTWELSLRELQSRDVITQMPFQPFHPGLRPVEKVD